MEEHWGSGAYRESVLLNSSMLAAVDSRHIVYAADVNGHGKMSGQGKVKAALWVEERMKFRSQESDRVCWKLTYLESAVVLGRTVAEVSAGRGDERGEVRSRIEDLGHA